MTRTRKGMTALIMAMLVFTACSPKEVTTTTAMPGGTNTTGQIEETTPGEATVPSTTTPVTTSAATQPVATTTGAPTGNSGRVADIMKRSTEAMGALDNYRVISESSFGLLAEEAITKTEMDMYPKDDATKMKMEIAGMAMDTYTVGDTIYMQMPGSGWMKMPNTEVSGEGEIVPLSDAEYADLFVMEETSDGYRVKTKKPISLEELQRLQNVPKEDLQAPGEDEEIEVDILVEMDMLIDRDYYTREMFTSMKFEVEGETVEAKVNTTMSHFNELPPFELPEEALNAPEFEIPELPTTP